MQKPTLACSAISREKGAPWYKTGSLSPRHWLRRPRSVSAPKSSTGSPSSSPRPREEDRLTKKQKKQQKKSRKQRRKQLQAHERKRQKAQAQAESDSKAVQLARSLSWTLLNAVKETRDKIAAPLDEEEEDLAFSIDSLSWSSSSDSSLSYSSSEEELSPSASPRLADSAAQLRLQAALAASKTNSLPSRSWRRREERSCSDPPFVLRSKPQRSSPQEEEPKRTMHSSARTETSSPTVQTKKNQPQKQRDCDGRGRRELSSSSSVAIPATTTPPSASTTLLGDHRKRSITLSSARGRSMRKEANKKGHHQVAKVPQPRVQVG